VKRLLITITIILVGVAGWAQKTADAGIQLSAMSYFGDVEEYDYLKSVSPGVGIFGRWNLNTRMSFRGQLIFSKLKAEGSLSDTYVAQPASGVLVFPRDETQVFSFNKSFQVFEVLYEYNFKDYKIGSTVAKFTPYIAVGGGLFYSQAGSGGSFITEPVVDVVLNGVKYYRAYEPEPNKRTDQLNTITAVIPFGMGVKWNISESLVLNAEALLRKTFSDNIDNLIDSKRFKNADANVAAGGGQYMYDDNFANSKLHNNDWFSAISVSISYVIWDGKRNCPIYK
jgi:hypothetical protein